VIPIAFRFDDPSPASDRALEVEILRRFAERGVPLTVAVIPVCRVNGASMELEGAHVEHIAPLARAGLVEVALHGYAHEERNRTPDGDPTEFWGVPLAQQRELLKSGQRCLAAVFGAAPEGFVPPWNTFDAATVAAARAEGFRYISAAREVPRAADGHVPLVPISCSVSQVWTAVPEAERFRTLEPVVIAVLHHYDFKESGATNSRLDLAELDRILDWVAGHPALESATVSRLAARIPPAHWRRSVRRWRIRARAHWRIQRRLPATCLLTGSLAGALCRKVFPEAGRRSPEAPRDGALQIATIRAAALYLRHSPLTWGRWRLIRAVLPMLRSAGNAMGQRLVRCRHGFTMLVDLEDWLGQYVYLTGAYEPPTADAIAMLIGPRDTVLDIGANAGFFTLLAAARVGPAGRVVAFEPIPAVRRELAANVARNGFANVAVREEAVSDRRARLRIFEGPREHRGISSLRQLEEAAASLEVPAIALDDLQHELGPVRLAKIDVEGAELLVLQGAAAVVARDHPHLVIEFTDEYLRAFGHSAEALGSWLLERGYALYRIEPTGLIRFGQGNVPANVQFSALCVHGNRLPAALAGKVRD